MAEAGGKIKDVQVNNASIVGNDGVANIPIATNEVCGAVKGDFTYGVVVNTGGRLAIRAATDAAVKGGTNYYLPLTASTQHQVVFYGLSKVAGVDLANETVTLGSYPETSKTAIRSMIGASSTNVIAIQDTQPTDPDTKIWLPETAETPVEVPTVAEMNAALSEKVGDVQIDGVSIVQDGVANIPVAGVNNAGVVNITTTS